jgi:hypothetical protein
MSFMCCEKVSPCRVWLPLIQPHVSAHNAQSTYLMHVQECVRPRTAMILRYPKSQGKAVFLAPTKPLVHQQMDACQQFMGSSKVR